MADGPHPFPKLDPDKNQIILIIGRKGSGKSVNAHRTFREWPHVDKFVIDPTGDADPGADLGTVTMRKLPKELPVGQRRGEYTVTRWIADPSSPTYREDLDRAVGLALYPKTRRVLLWVDEAGEVFPANRTGPHARTLLQQSRHWYASVILCCPRPVTIDPLCLAQADRVIIYDVPNPADRRRIADSIGMDPTFFARQMDETKAKGEHWFMVYVASEHALYRCPPLPMESSYKHAQQ